MTEGERIIRPSSLTTTQDCERRWAAHHLGEDLARYGYELPNTRPIHIGAAVGSGVHAAAAYTLEAKRADGGLGAESEAIDRAEAEFDERTQFGVAWDETTSDLSTAKKQLARMTRTYRRKVAPETTPLLVEQRLLADVGDGWQLSGQADVLGGDPDDELDDLKTGARQRANGAQYGAYALIYRAHGYNLKKLSEVFIKRVKLAVEQPEPARTSIDLNDASRDAWELIERIKATSAEFVRRAEDPAGRWAPGAFRANPASVLCGAKWCRAWGTDFCRSHLR